MSYNAIAVKRHFGLDLLKTVAIFFVILYHGMAFETNVYVGSAANYAKYFLQSCLSCCVPLFFLINGALELNRPFCLKKHIRKMIKLILLVVFWGALTILILCFTRGENMGLLEFAKTLISLRSNWINHLWFLTTLFTVYVFLPIVKYCFDNAPKLYGYFLVVVLFFSFGRGVVDTIINLMRTFSWFPNITSGYNWFGSFDPFLNINGYALGYFMIGGVLFRKQEKLKSLKVYLTVGILLPLSVFCLFLYGLLASYIDGGQYDVVCSGYDSVFTLVTTVCMAIAFMPLKNGVIFERFISVCGSNTLGIYLIHWILLTSLENYLWRLPNYSTVLGKLTACILNFLISLFITLILKRFSLTRKLVII